jgi:hypothetical protein
MSISYISEKLKTVAAKNFVDSFKTNLPSKLIGYIFLSKSSEYTNENEITSDLIDTVEREKQIWDDMILAKKIIENNINLILPNYQWSVNTRYKQYDDTIPLKDLLNITIEGNDIIRPMFVINRSGDVYKCISNNLNSLSVSEPKSSYAQNKGFIQTDFDSYIWKYMFNVKLSSKFLTEDWIPVPYIQANTSYLEYNYDSNSIIKGTLNNIIVTDSGTNYYHTQVSVEPFLAGTTELTVSDNIDLTTSNTIFVNMAVSGTGIFLNNTHIRELSGLRKIILSKPTISSGGGNSTSNLITISTRVEIIGDGTETTTSVELNSNNTIKQIVVTNTGINYTQANVIIYGSGTGAKARVILPPKLGHGYNPAIELGASNVMVVSRIGEIDATENNKIPVGINFRQYGLLVNPHKYNENQPMTSNNFLSVVSQTLDLIMAQPSSVYEIGEMVYQGNISNPSFVGYVVSQNGNLLRLNNFYKNVNIGTLLLIGKNSQKSNIVINVKNPDLEPYTGDIIFARNILKVPRSLAQAEEVKLVFQF